MSSLTFRTLTGVIFSLMWLGPVSPGLAPSLANPTALNYIFEIQGDVQIKRSQWNSYRKANEGDLLDPSDQLQLKSGASAQVMCSNLSIWSLKGDTLTKVSAGCPSGKLIITRPNTHRSPTRAPNETIPYIISPRNTALLTNRPILRWKGIPGATLYKVRVQDASLTIDWSTETSNTQIEYPGEPPLQPDSYYLLIVKTDQGKSSEEEQGTDLSFTLLDAQKAESVRTEVTQIKQQKLNPEAEGLGLAYLYQSYDLKAEAIELLEGLIKQGSQTTAIYQLLGDLYLQVGLSQQTKNHYLKALEFAQKNEDIEGQAKAQMGLGEAEYGLGDKKKASEWLNQAKVSYAVLGDQSKVQELEKRIKSL